MAKSFALEVVETSNTTGTGAYALAGIPAGSAYRTFRQEFANGETKIVYVVRNKDNTKWEANRFGTLTYGTPDALTRNVVRSTNTDAPVPWVAGDLPLTMYIPANADVHEGAITGWLAATPSDLLRYGFGNKEDDPSAGLNRLFFRDGNGTDIDVAVVDPTAHSMVLDPTLSAWRQLQVANPVAASTVDFINIPASINHLMVVFEVTVGTDGATLNLQTYDAGGNLDSGASDYQYMMTSIATTGATGVVTSASAAAIAIATGSDNGNNGIGGTIVAANIQAATLTKFQFQNVHQNQAVTATLFEVGGGIRSESDRITGLRISPSAGTITGKFTLYGSV